MYFILSGLLIQHPFQFQAGSEAAEESAVTRHVLRKGLAGGGGGVGKNPVLQKSLQGFPLLPQNHKGGKQRHAVGPALPCRGQTGHRHLAGGSQVPLAYSRSLEHAPVTHQILDGHIFLGKQIKADAQGSGGCVELGAQEIGQIHPAVRAAQHQREALIQMGDALPRQIVDADHSAAVRVCLQALLVQPGVKLVGIEVRPKKPGSLPKQGHPDVHVVGAVIAVDM